MIIKNEDASMRCCGPEGCGTLRPTPEAPAPYTALSPVARYCIRMRCMAWRAYHSDGKDGYCGLAGNPGS